MAKTVYNNICTDKFLRHCNNDINIYNFPIKPEKINKIINKIIFKEKSLMLDDYSYIMKSIRKNNQIDN